MLPFKWHVWNYVGMVRTCESCGQCGDESRLCPGQETITDPLADHMFVRASEHVEFRDELPLHFHQYDKNFVCVACGLRSDSTGMFCTRGEPIRDSADLMMFTKTPPHPNEEILDAMLQLESELAAK